jgi:hypothetical protein
MGCTSCFSAYVLGYNPHTFVVVVVVSAMTLVDFIDLDDDECYLKVDVIDLSTDEDSVKKDGNVEEEEEAQSKSKNLAEAATSSPEQDATAATPLSMVDYGFSLSSLVADKSMQPGNQEFLAIIDGAKEALQPGNHEIIAAGDCMGKAMQSEREADVFLSITEQVAATSLLLKEQGAITSSLREDKSMQSGNQVFVAAVNCTKEAIQSENTTKAAGSPSMTERGVTCKSHHVGQLCQMVGCPHIVGDGLDLCISHGGGHPHGEPGSSTVPCTKSEVSIKHKRHSGIRVKGVVGNSLGSTGICNHHALEELEGYTEKDEKCDFEAETETLSPQYNEKETTRFGKFYERKGKKQVNTSATACNIQLSIVDSKGVPPTVHNGDTGFSVMGNVSNCTATASIGINVPDCEVVVSTYQGCSNTSQGNTMYGKVHDNSSKSCMVEGCTNGAHGGTPLCIIHNSRSRKKWCAVIGCSKVARNSSQGRRGCCVKHGGGKRCKYDGCGKGAKGKTHYCIGHGGGRRCKFQGCRKGAQGRSDYCLEHGGGRRCKFIGCSASTTCGTDLCSMHITSLLSGNNSDQEMQPAPAPAPAPARQSKKAEPSKGRNSHSVIRGRSQKKQNTNDYVNTRSFNVVEV